LKFLGGITAGHSINPNTNSTDGCKNANNEIYAFISLDCIITGRFFSFGREIDPLSRSF
jgi:hypothetical protein